MDIERIKSFLHSQLGTTEAVNRLANAIGVSQATMYRYKSNPEAMQIGQYLKLTETIGMPVAEQVAWLPKDFLPEERHRLKHEQMLAKERGTRMTVTPYFTVNDELPIITELTAEEVYGSASQRLLPEYLEARTERKRLYQEQAYTSKEIINGYMYVEFFQRKKRFRAISENDRNQQIELLIDSLHRGKVHRRIFLGYDLPIVTWYSIGVALVRFGEFTIEVNGDKLTQAVADVFNEYYARCDIKNIDDVNSFLQNPEKFIYKSNNYGD